MIEVPVRAEGESELAGQTSRVTVVGLQSVPVVAHAGVDQDKTAFGLDQERR